MMARESVCFMPKLRQLCQYVHNTRARICHRRRRRRCIRAFVKALRVCEINIFCFQSIYARYPTTICTYCTYHIRIAVFFGWRTPSCLCSLTLAQHEIVRLLVVCVCGVLRARVRLSVQGKRTCFCQAHSGVHFMYWTRIYLICVHKPHKHTTVCAMYNKHNKLYAVLFFSRNVFHVYNDLTLDVFYTLLNE